MPVIPARKVEGGENFSEDDRKQILRLDKGLYGGMFARYSMPKTYTNQWGTDEKFNVWFVITHDRTGKQLPHFSEAWAMIKTKSFYKAETGMKSAYVAIVYALLAGKEPYERVAEGLEHGSYDLNEFIGRPCWLFVEPSAKPNKDGLYVNRLTSIEPMDKQLWHAAKPLYEARKVETSAKDLARLVVPKPAFEDEVKAPDFRPEDEHFEDDFDDVPF